MSVAKVREFLRAKGFAERVQEFAVSSATVELAALAVGVEPARIAKTLSFLVEETPVLIVCAGDAKIDNARYKAHFHAKAKMIPFERAEELVGHAPGGVCPFALPEGVPTYLDRSLCRFDVVYPAAGSAASAVRLSPEELEQAAQAFAGWVDVCKGWQTEEGKGEN
ncbi:MAG: YbaK/EbsC family protein [Eubacteriales bacterium]|nr:YbaK/EbsC family protein [Eubacteriales bacterium]